MFQIKTIARHFPVGSYLRHFAIFDLRENPEWQETIQQGQVAKNTGFRSC